MPEREFYGDVTVTQLVEPASHTTTVTSNMVTCDANMVAILVSVGLWTTDETVDFKLTESAASDFSNPADVAAADFEATPTLAQVASASTDQKDFLIRYTGSLGYIKLVGTHGGSGACVWGASVLKGGVKATPGDIV